MFSSISLQICMHGWSQLESLKTLNPMGCLKWNAITALWGIVDSSLRPFFSYVSRGTVCWVLPIARLASTSAGSKMLAGQDLLPIFGRLSQHNPTFPSNSWQFPIYFPSNQICRYSTNMIEHVLNRQMKLTQSSKELQSVWSGTSEGGIRLFGKGTGRGAAPCCQGQVRKAT